MATSFVVSPNYIDRDNAFGWLVRDENKTPDSVRAARQVVAQDVEFIQSTEEEAGFGCGTIAVAGEVETSMGSGEIVPVGAVPLKFNEESKALTSLAGRIVEGAAAIFCDIDRCLYAVDPYFAD